MLKDVTSRDNSDDDKQIKVVGVKGDKSDDERQLIGKLRVFLENKRYKQISLAISLIHCTLIFRS